MIPGTCRESSSTENGALAGQIVLVTGGARRLGRAICEMLWRLGAVVVIHCHKSLTDAQALADSLGERSLVVNADLRDRLATEQMFADIVKKLGRIDAVVCSAAGFGRSPMDRLSDEVWDELLALNLTAPRRCMQLGIKAGAQAIVNIVDVGATQAWRGYAAYGVSKAGLLQLTRIAAKELVGKVRVNAVAPGYILPPDDISLEERERLGQKWAGYPVGTPQDVASAVAFLLSEPFLTGVCLPVDGGQSL